MPFAIRSLVPVALVAAVVVAAQAPAAAQTRMGEEPIVVGSVASLTGSATAYGRDQARGTRLAVSILNRRPAPGAARLALRGADDRSRAAAAQAAFRRLVRIEASAIVGPTLSPVAELADPIAANAGIPVLAATNTTLDIADLQTVWRVSLSERAMIPQALAAVRERRGLRRAALLVDRADGYARGAGDVFSVAARRAGIRLTGTAFFDSGAGSLEQAIALLRAGGGLRSAGGPAPQALLVAARGDAAVAALKAIRAADGAIPVVGGNGFNADEVIAAAGDDAEGLTVAASWNAGIVHPRSRAFVRAFRKRFKAEPSAFAAQGYASVEIAAAAARAGGGTMPSQMQNGLARLGLVDTVLGPLRFSRAREARYPAAVQVVRDGRFRLLARTASIRGSWSGLLRQRGMRPFRVWATIASPAGDAGNRVRYSGLDCRGRWNALARRRGAYRFTEVITAGGSDACKGRGTVTLTPTADPNALRYVFRGGGVTSRGVLRRLS